MSQLLYCENCQVLSRDGKTCPLCEGKKLRPVRPDDPVLLLTVGEEESIRITSAFDDAKIPCMAQTLGAGGILNIIGGQARSTERRIFVPFREVEHAREVLVGIGALREKPKGPEPEEQIPENRGKRIATRIFGAVLFLTLVWIVVSFTDMVASFFKSLFH